MKDIKDEKTVPFYKIYQPMLKTHGNEVALLIAVMAAKQTYMYKYGKQDNAGFFYFEHPEIEKVTQLSEYRQKAAMRVLVDLKLLTIDNEKKGTPPKKFYKVDTMKYENYVQKLYEKHRSEKPRPRISRFK